MLCLDHSVYAGTEDFEIEYEGQSLAHAESILTQLLAEADVPFIRAKNKVARFTSKQHNKTKWRSISPTKDEGRETRSPFNSHLRQSTFLLTTSIRLIEKVCQIFIVNVQPKGCTFMRSYGMC